MSVLLGEPWRSVFIYLGPTVALLIVGLYGFYMGWWRTKWEVEAWVDRAERAERLAETILPAVHNLATSLDRLTTLIEARLK